MTNTQELISVAVNRFLSTYDINVILFNLTLFPLQDRQSFKRPKSLKIILIPLLYALMFAQVTNAANEYYIT